MKSFFKKYGFALIFGLFCLGAVCLTIIISFDNLASTLSYQMDRDHEDATRYKANNRMIAYGENGVSTIPVSAKVENGILKIEAEVTNNSGKNLKVKDFDDAGSEQLPFSHFSKIYSFKLFIFYFLNVFIVFSIDLTSPKNSFNEYSVLQNLS